MITSLNKQQRRGLAVALLLILLLLLYQLLIKPFFFKYMEYGEQINSLEHQIQIYQRLSQNREQLEQQLKSYTEDTSLSELYLEETKPALAAASLQQYLSRAIRLSGGQVVSTNILNQPDDSPLLKVTIQLHLRQDINQLTQLLHQLESGKPLLFIDSLVVTSSPRLIRESSRQQRNRQQRFPRLQSQTLSRTNQVNPIDVKFNLIGYALKEDPS